MTAPTIVASAAAAPVRRGERRRWAAAVAFACVALLVAARTARHLNVPGVPGAPQYGLADFRDAIYYPVIAWLDGTNPYDPLVYAARYPVTATFALYAPHTLVLHLPFGLLPLRIAGAVYFAIELALVLALAWLALTLAAVRPHAERVLALAAVLIASRPGQSTLFLGQYAITVTVGAYLALGWARTRTWIAALGVALCAVKPTFGLPLMVLLLARGDWRAVAGGAIVAALLAVPPLVRIAAAVGPDPRAWLELAARNQRVFGATEVVASAASVTRIDAASLVGRVFGGSGAAETAMAIGMLAIGALVIVRLSRRRDPRARTLSHAVICTTVLAAVYHQGYDALLLAAPLVALGLAPQALPPIATAERWLLIALWLVPFVNYASTFTVVHALAVTGSRWTLLTGINAAAICAAWALVVSWGFRSPASAR
jgi:hypothetical protein